MHQEAKRKILGKAPTTMWLGRVQCSTRGKWYQFAQTQEYYAVIKKSDFYMY